MIPVPQYPIYSALISFFNGQQIGYYLDEDNEWTIQQNEINYRHEKALKQGINPQAIVVINPSNPTGSIIDKEKLQDIIHFAYKHDLLILADEVYQENIYSGEGYVTMRRVLMEMDTEIANKVRMLSFHSLSKGLFGECGWRGGSMCCLSIRSKSLIGNWFC